MSAPKILVVEDERIVALHLQQQLTKLGYQIAGMAASGEAALAAIAETSPDLVLMDIHIEGDLDGVDTAGRIAPELDLPVVYLTAFSEETTLERARATKPYGYLIKPYSERELHATIQMALERRRVASALRASEDRLRSIVDAVSEGIFVIDADTGRFAQVNAPGLAMFGYRADELIGQAVGTLSSGTPPYTQKEAVELIQRQMESRLPYRLDWHCKTKDDRLFWAEFSTRSATIGGQDVLLAIVRDLTQQRVMEDRLRHVQKMEAIGQLTGGVAHDFNNLLAIVIGNLDLLRELRPDDRELDELSGEALTAALGGAELTRQLLAFARRQPLQPEPVDLNSFIERSAKLLRRVLPDDIGVTLDLTAACSVLVDRVQLGAALTNLATNARDAMPGGGTLLIATGRRHLDADYVASHAEVTAGDYAVIEVTDAGSGMPPEVIDHIFEPFYTTKSRDKGTGLGLSMVFGFLKQSGGHVSVYSEPGVGTTFRLYLPCTTETADVRPNPPPGPSAGKGETVLVVEDDARLRRLAVRKLEAAGYKIFEAKDGAEALDQLAACSVDLLFTDIVMPGGIDGLELANTAVRRWPGLKVLLTSGFPENSLVERLAASGFPMLSKPYRQTDLVEVLRGVLDPSEADSGGG
jgi:PAS domain S-box-containing protein